MREAAKAAARPTRQDGATLPSKSSACSHGRACVAVAGKSLVCNCMPVHSAGMDRPTTPVSARRRYSWKVLSEFEQLRAIWR